MCALESVCRKKQGSPEGLLLGGLVMLKSMDSSRGLLLTLSLLARLDHLGVMVGRLFSDLSVGVQSVYSPLNRYEQSVECTEDGLNECRNHNDTPMFAAELP